MSTEIWHSIKKRSVWDGTTTMWCGITVPEKLSEESLFGGSAPRCPACKAAKKGAKK